MTIRVSCHSQRIVSAPSLQIGNGVDRSLTGSRGRVSRPDHRQAGHEADLKKRTLTNLYNARPAWLANLHADLDAAVAAAYGWPWPLSDDEILRRLFELNQARS